jgi:DNA-binding NarL/FixJ family response regulator
MHEICASSCKGRTRGSIALKTKLNASIDRSTGCEQARKITVLVADYSRLGTELLVATLSASDQVAPVACEAKLESFVPALKTFGPDVAIIGADARTGGALAFEMVRVVRSALASVAPVVLLDSDDITLVVEAFRAGARGVCCHDNSMDELIQCVKAVHSGQVWMSSVHLRPVVEALAETYSPVKAVQFNGTSSLSKRELEIVRAVTDGLSNQAIATRLQLSRCTVKNYLRRVFEKVGVSNRTELALYALNHHSLPNGQAKKTATGDPTRVYGEYAPF